MANEKRLIDANAVLAGIETFMQCYAENEKELTPFWVKVAINALEMVRQLIKEMPTVDAVEVVHAEWGDGGAVDRNGNIVYKSIDCSNCLEYFKIESHDREYWKARFKVCPFCGAIMDGERKDNGSNI